MTIRLRVPELLDEAGIDGWWQLYRRAPDRLSATMAKRLVVRCGQLETFPRATLDALCAVLDVPVGALFTTDPAPPPAPPRPRGRRAKAPTTPSTLAPTAAIVKPASKTASKSATKLASKSATKSATKRRP
jgi:hypothetical protein